MLQEEPGKLTSWRGVCAWYVQAAADLLLCFLLLLQGLIPTPQGSGAQPV